MTALVVAALVERGHRLVCRPGLQLHEVRTLVTALGALSVCRVYVLPRRLAAQDVVNLLLREIDHITIFQ